MVPPGQRHAAEQSTSFLGRVGATLGFPEQLLGVGAALGGWNLAHRVAWDGALVLGELQDAMQDGPHASRDSRPTLAARWACQRRTSAGLTRSMGRSPNQCRASRSATFSRRSPGRSGSSPWPLRFSGRWCVARTGRDAPPPGPQGAPPSPSGLTFVRARTSYQTGDGRDPTEWEDSFDSPSPFADPCGPRKTDGPARPQQPCHRQTQGSSAPPGDRAYAHRADSR